VIWPDGYRGCNWRKLRAAALQESHAHRAYARHGMPAPKTQPLTLWPDTQLQFGEHLPDAGSKNGKTMTRLSWDNLAAWCGQDLPDNESPTNIGDIGIVSRMTGINRGTLYNNRRNGFTVWQADDIACNLGVHPSAIWPDWYELTAVDDEEEARHG
jgi:lambda repressor-like predicted transcriptional regulator